MKPQTLQPRPSPPPLRSGMQEITLQCIEYSRPDGQHPPPPSETYDGQRYGGTGLGGQGLDVWETWDMIEERWVGMFGHAVCRLLFQTVWSLQVICTSL